MGRKSINLEGKTFGRLTVIKRDYSKTKRVYWICQCNCKDKIIKSIASGELLREHTISCGCYQKENMSRIKKKYNTYDLTGEYGIGYTSNTNESFYFDLEDYDKIKNYCWYEDDDGYIVSTICNNKDKPIIIKLHRLIMNVEINKEVDHIFHNKNDNRKKFLRIVTGSQNQMNTVLRKDNTSGQKGVSWHKRDQCWEAYIQVNKKNIYLGSFNNFDDAVKVRKEAEEKYFGEYSYYNSMNKNIK